MTAVEEEIKRAFSEIASGYEKLGKLFGTLASAAKTEEEPCMTTASAPHPTPKSSAKVAKDPLAPKKPMSSFILFCHYHRNSVKQAHPEMNGKDITLQLGQMWRDEKDKSRYEEEARKLNQEYKVLKENYDAQKKLQGGNPLSVSEEDHEEDSVAAILEEIPETLKAPKPKVSKKEKRPLPETSAVPPVPAAPAAPAVSEKPLSQSPSKKKSKTEKNVTPSEIVPAEVPPTPVTTSKIESPTKDHVTAASKAVVKKKKKTSNASEPLSSQQ